MRRLLLLLLTSLCVLLGSCSTIGAFIKANMNDVPYWYYEESIGLPRKTKKAFVSKATDMSERQALLIAYSNILDDVCEYTGQERTQEDYRQLCAIASIDRFSLSVMDTVTVSEPDQSFTVYVRAVADSSVIEQSRSEELKRQQSLIDEIVSIVDLGDRYVMDNCDARALKCYLNAMSLCWGCDFLEENYSFQNLYSEVMSMLEEIVISVDLTNPESASCRVHVRRKGRFIDSSVKDSPILATYSATDSRGSLYSDSFVYTTGNDGSFTFNPLNYTLSGSGDIVFSLDVAQEIQALEEASGQNMEELRQAAMKVSAGFGYSLKNLFEDLVVTALSYDIEGNATDNAVMTDYIRDLFLAEGFEVRTFYAPLELDSADQMESAAASSMQCGSVLVFQCGVLSSTTSKLGVDAVSVEGALAIYDAESSDIVHQSSITYASATGATFEEALDNAMKRLADTLYSLIKVMYV